MGSTLSSAPPAIHAHSGNCRFFGHEVTSLSPLMMSEFRSRSAATKIVSGHSGATPTYGALLMRWMRWMRVALITPRSKSSLIIGLTNNIRSCCSARRRGTERTGLAARGSDLRTGRCWGVRRCTFRSPLPSTFVAGNYRVSTAFTWWRRQVEPATSGWEFVRSHSSWYLLFPSGVIQARVFNSFDGLAWWPFVV